MPSACIGLWHARGSTNAHLLTYSDCCVPRCQVFMLTCDWGTISTGKVSHLYFQGVQCLATPHVVHMVVAVITSLVLCFCVLAMVSAGRGWACDCGAHPGYSARSHAACSM